MSLNFLKEPLGLQILAYVGLTGAGKSLSAVENHCIDSLKLGKSVYSNTWLNWNLSNLHTFTKWSDLHTVRNSIIFIDEIGDILDPNKYKDFSDEDKNVIRYHRKRGNTIIYTAQDISDVAKQCRVKTHKFIICEADPDSALVVWFLKTFLSIERVSFKTLVLTFKDLKKLSLGIGSPALVDPDIDPEEDNSFSEDISDISNDLKGSKDVPKPEHIRFKLSTLQHKELDKYKIHLFGAWCPDCRGFKSYHDKDDVNLSNCPSCPTVALQMKSLSMYDTNLELETLLPDEVITKRFKYTLKKTLTPIDSNL